jgi:hypothetical protein
MNIRPEIQALVDRGGVTLVEWLSVRFRSNMREQEALVPALDEEAFAHYAEYVLKHSGISGPRPCASYREALALVVVPEMLKRFQASREARESLEDFFVSAASVLSLATYVNIIAAAKARYEQRTRAR